MAVPGMVLGIGYILFFNHPANPLHCSLRHDGDPRRCRTVVHFYSSSHLTAVTALKQLDDEFESVSASLKVPFYKTFWRVTVPVCLPTIIDIGRYYFVNAMTTISAVVFLYSPKTTLASISILQLDEAGRDRLRRGDGDADRRRRRRSSPSLSLAAEGWLLRRTQALARARAATRRPSVKEPIPMSTHVTATRSCSRPGPLTTSLATKAAMLRDWGSWDAAFNAVTARVRAQAARRRPRPATRTSACRCRAAARSRSRRRSTRWCRATATCWC